MSQGELANEILGVAPHELSKWRNNHTPLTFRGAQALDIGVPPESDPLTVWRRAYEIARARERNSPSVSPPEDMNSTGLQGVYLDALSLYAAAARLINDGDRRPADRVICIGTLHGHSGPRLNDERSSMPELPEPMKAFDRAITARIDSDTNAPWVVRELCNVTTPARLATIRDRIKRFDDSPHYEVRGYCRPEALSMLAPLIVGNSDVILATEHLRYYRADAGIHFKGREVAAWALSYFERLWARADYELRTPIGINSDALQRLAATVERSRASRAERDRRADSEQGGV